MQIADDAAQIAGDDADEEADRHRDAVGDEADDQRGARAEEKAGEQVAAERVGAEQEMAIRRQRRAFDRQAVEHLVIGAEGSDPGRGDRHDHDKDDDDKPEQRRRLTQHSLDHMHQLASGKGSAPPTMKAESCSIGRRRRIAQLRRMA